MRVLVTGVSTEVVPKSSVLVSSTMIVVPSSTTISWGPLITEVVLTAEAATVAVVRVAVAVITVLSTTPTVVVVGIVILMVSA